jgi:uncharacterized protein with HEPN domain
VTLPRLRDYLSHIVTAVERIQEYTRGLDADAFAEDRLVQDAVIRNIEIIGEASRRLQLGYPEFSSAHPDLPLAAAYQMRNAVAHGYFAVDLDIVWSTIRSDLPSLGDRARELLSDPTE